MNTKLNKKQKKSLFRLLLLPLGVFAACFIIDIIIAMLSKSFLGFSFWCALGFIPLYSFYCGAKAYAITKRILLPNVLFLFIYASAFLVLFFIGGFFGTASSITNAHDFLDGVFLFLQITSLLGFLSACASFVFSLISSVITKISMKRDNETEKQPAQEEQL